LSIRISARACVLVQNLKKKVKKDLEFQKKSLPLWLETLKNFAYGVENELEH